MKNKIKSILSVIITLIICFSVFPTTVYAKSYDARKVRAFHGSHGYTEFTIPNTVSCSICDVWEPIDFFTIDYFYVNEGDEVNFKLVMNNGSQSRYASFNNDLTFIQVYYHDSKPNTPCLISARDQIVDLSYDGSSTFTCSFIAGYDGYVNFSFYAWPDSLRTPLNPNYYEFKLTSIDFDVETSSGSILSRLKNWFSSLFQQFRELKDNISDLGSNIGNWFSGLGDRISGFFTNLSNDIKDRFTDLKNNLSTFFSNVGTWFTNLGDRISNFFTTLGDNISGFFEKLWNRIYWGNENGASEYERPVINNKLNDIIDTLDGYQISLKSTIDTIGDTAEDVSSYMENMTMLFNGIINVAGAGFTVLIVFGIVFILVRKVVGR